MFWSPDSKKLVVLRTEAGEDHKIYMVESSPTNQVQPKLHTIDYRKPGDRLPITKPHLFDVTSGKEIPVSDELFQKSVEHQRISLGRGIRVDSPFFITSADTRSCG